jgi:hypothetical protein
MGLVAELSHAQTRKPTLQEVAAIQHCVNKNKDDIDEGERRCLFNLVADRDASVTWVPLPTGSSPIATKLKDRFGTIC